MNFLKKYRFWIGGASRFFVTALIIGGIRPKVVSGAASPTPLEVQVVQVEQRDVPIYEEWIGTLDGLVNADVRAQVAGYFMEQGYLEGAYVKKGQLLFQIDARPFTAALDQAQGQLAQAKAMLPNAEAVRGPIKGSIKGVVTVQGPNGEFTVLEGMTLELSGGSQARVSLSVITDAAGHYQFDGLKAGTYQLQAHAEGLQSMTKTIPLGPDELLVENVVLQFQTVVQNVEVHDQAEGVSTAAAVQRASIKSQQFTTLPLAVQKFNAALPLVPGVIRTSNGKLNIKGAPENQGMLLVDSAQTVDPVTGSFSIPVPVDAIQTMHVKETPYDTEYGGFSGGLTTIETKPPSSQWKYGLMDFIPGVRGKSGHIVGLSDETPRVFFGGPIITNKLNFSEAATYDYNNRPVRGLAWPHNETRIEGFNSLTSLQAVLSPRHLLSVNINSFSNRVRYANIGSLVPQSASSDDGQRGVSAGATDSYQFGSGALLSTMFAARQKVKRASS